MADNIRKKIEEELKQLKENADQFSSAVEIIGEARNMSANAEDLIQKTFSENKGLFQKASDSLGELIETQGSQLTRLNEDLEKLTSLQEKLSETDIPNKLAEIKEGIDKSRQSLISGQEAIKSAAKNADQKLVELDKGLQDIQEIGSENQKVLNEKLETIHLYLKNSDDKLRANQKQLFEQINKMYKDLSGELKTGNEEITGALKTNRILTIVLFIIMLLQMALIIYIR